MKKQKIDVVMRKTDNILNLEFISEAAKKLIREKTKDVPYLSEGNILKFDVDYKYKNNIIAWLVSHNLSSVME